jgi:hypothetical protein
VRERDRCGPVELEALADGVGESPYAEQPPSRQSADGDDQARV